MAHKTLIFLNENNNLKEMSPGCSLEGMILKLKLQYFGHLMGRVDSLEKTLMLGGLGAGGEGDDRGWDGWMASPIRWMWVWVNSGSWWWTGRPGMLQFMGSQRVIHDWTTQLNWTELNINGGSVVLYNNCSSRKCCWIIDWLEFMVEVSIFLNTKTEYKESEAILIGWKMWLFSVMHLLTNSHPTF